MILLADISAADPGNLRDILLFIGFALSGGASAVAILNSRRAQKREVSFSNEFITKNDCDLMHSTVTLRVNNIEAAIRSMREELRGEISAITREGESRAVKLHDRINEILHAVGRIEGQITSLRES